MATNCVFSNMILYQTLPFVKVNTKKSSCSSAGVLLTLCSRVVNLINYPLMPEQFKFFEFSTPKCTVTYILTL
jgi:hypothetical protein